MKRRGAATHLVLLTCSFAALACAISHAFQVEAPEPYMDEIFHVPQTRRYCSGQWLSWDPKITTFPGLYVLGAAAGRAAHAARSRLAPASNASEPCTTAQLRAVNVALATAAVPLFWHLAAALDPSRSNAQLGLLTTACAFFPLHFFYTFLYYTDVASTFFTLAAWLAAVRRRYALAGVLAAAAVAVRQTNAVWAAFALGWAALDICLPGAQAAAGGKKRGDGEAERWRAAGGRGALNARGLCLEAGSWHDVAPLLRRAWALRGHLASRLGPLLAVVAAFAAFVSANGGVAVGDKEHHAPVRHLVQPLYCALYCTLCLAPVFWTPSALRQAGKAHWRQLRSSPVAEAAGAVCAGGAAAAAVARGTLAHPFLLADNRHYTFYLWRRVVNATPWARYALIPAYLYSLAALRRGLAHRHPLRAALLAGAVCVVLTPAHLVEPRYYTLPCLAALLLLRTPPPGRLAAVIAGFAAVNALTVWAYLARPFQWGDGSVARFMW